LRRIAVLRKKPLKHFGQLSERLVKALECCTVSTNLVEALRQVAPDFDLVSMDTKLTKELLELFRAVVVGRKGCFLDGRIVRLQCGSSPAERQLMELFSVLEVLDGLDVVLQLEVQHSFEEVGERAGAVDSFEGFGNLRCLLGALLCCNHALQVGCLRKVGSVGQRLLEASSCLLGVSLDEIRVQGDAEEEIRVLRVKLQGLEPLHLRAGLPLGICTRELEEQSAETRPRLDVGRVQFKSPVQEASCLLDGVGIVARREEQPSEFTACKLLVLNFQLLQALTRRIAVVSLRKHFVRGHCKVLVLFRLELLKAVPQVFKLLDVLFVTQSSWLSGCQKFELSAEQVFLDILLDSCLSLLQAAINALSESLVFADSEAPLFTSLAEKHHIM
jgi:hypothetical protein